jgi:transaldolase
MEAKNPMLKLRDLGQSPWCDQLSRQMLVSGQLADLISKQGIVGLTSNPTIFQKALAQSDLYDQQIRDASARGLDAEATYEELAVRDIQAVADLLWPIYETTDRRDGYVSLEVSPHLAHDTDGSIAAARRLWAAVDRPNLMVKIPGTAAGLPAITTLLSEGVNVNITLLFGLGRYREVLEAHTAGLARALETGLDLRRIASVASFFVSRVDTLVDRLLDFKAGIAGDPLEQAQLLELRGRAAIANARAARVAWEEWNGVEPARRIVAAGGRPQRLLWASTSAKNPAYRDVVYLEELIGPDTVTTIPIETIGAFAEHGRIRGVTLTDPAAVEASAATLRALAQARIKMESVAEELETAGIELFAESYAQLLDGVAAKANALLVGGSV